MPGSPWSLAPPDEDEVAQGSRTLFVRRVNGWIRVTTFLFAETFLPWLPVRYRTDRVSSQLAILIRTTIPNRIDYLDGRSFAMHPMQ